VIRAAQRALDNSLGRPFTHLTSLDFSNAFNTVDRREIASGLRRFAPSLYRARKWAYGTPSDLILTNRENLDYLQPFLSSGSAARVTLSVPSCSSSASDSS
jgi:hypothetical protein